MDSDENLAINILITGYFSWFLRKRGFTVNVDVSYHLD